MPSQHGGSQLAERVCIPSIPDLVSIWRLLIGWISVSALDSRCYSNMAVDDWVNECLSPVVTGDWVRYWDPLSFSFFVSFFLSGLGSGSSKLGCQLKEEEQCLFLSILWCSQSGDHPYEDLAKFFYKRNMKIKRLKILLYFCYPTSTMYRNLGK